jgi:hypothetical protein
MAQQADFHRDPKKRSRPFRPIEFNPYRKRIRQTRRTITPDEYREIFGE